MSENNNGNFKENINLKKCACPGCGASLNINDWQKVVTCEYCGMTFKVDEGVKSRNTYTTRTPEEYHKIGKTVATIVIICVVSFWALIILISILGAIFSAEKGTNSSVKSSSQTKEEVILVNPYENINIQLADVAPWGRIVNVKGDDELSRVEYKVSKTEGLSNGDKVIITAEEMKGYSWTESSYEYTVEGLDELVTDISMLSDDDKELIYSEAEALLIKEWEKNIEGCKFTIEDIKLELEPYNLYLKVSQSDYYASYLDNNVVMPAFKTTFVNKDKTYTIYQYADLSNVIITSDGQLKADFDVMGGLNGFSFGDDYGFKNQYFAIYGYDRVIQMESSMEKDNYKLYK